MAAIIDMPKPTIHILYTPNVSETVLRQMFYGMEEEGIPWEAEEREGADALALAWEAAQASRLEVGIGVDNSSVILQTPKMEREQPLYRIPARSIGLVRVLGANAARLVKKLPLKPLDGR